jgi:hypothetical protein
LHTPTKGNEIVKRELGPVGVNNKLEKKRNMKNAGIKISCVNSHETKTT